MQVIDSQTAAEESIHHSSTNPKAYEDDLAEDNHVRLDFGKRRLSCYNKGDAG